MEVFQYKPPKCPCVQQQQLHGVDGKKFYVPIKAGLLQTNWVCIYIYKNKKQREDSEACACFVIRRNEHMCELRCSNKVLSADWPRQTCTLKCSAGQS